MPPPFTSFAFIFLVIVSLPVYWLLNGKTKIQNLYLLIISYIIYCFITYWLGIVLFFSTLVNYICGYLLGKTERNNLRKLIIYISVIFNVAYLYVFKYFDFFSTELSKFLGLFGLKITPFLLFLLLPIGISYYTLQAISYNIEIYRNNIQPLRNFIVFALFLAYFPKMTAGPIERPQSLILQFLEKKQLDQKRISSAIQLILIGFFKKIVIADFIGSKISDFYEDPTGFSSTASLIIVWLFAIQIYADFSGYTSIVRGISKLFGIDLRLNFNQPYLSGNIRDFWRRWHMSFSEWLRDYTYIPLGGNRKHFLRTLLNLMVVFIIAGIWHGAGINFIIWGFLHGSFLIIHRIYLSCIKKLTFYRKMINPRNNTPRIHKIIRVLYKLVAWFITFQLVAFAWIFFHTDDFETAMLIIKQAYSMNYNLNYNYDNYVLISTLIFSCLFILIIDIAEFKLKTHEILTNLHWILKAIILAFIIIMLLLFQFNIEEPFIYEGY
ncbi:MAG: MBOAT family O-acyltransferase [Promethearchaeota archaeon]